MQSPITQPEPVAQYQGTIAACSVWVQIGNYAGSGTVIARRGDQALVLLCRHQVEGRSADAALVRFPGGKEIAGRVYAVDDVADLAALVIPVDKDAQGNDMPVTALGDAPLVAGDRVVNVGYGPASDQDRKPMARAGVCRGVGGTVRGRFGSYQSIDLQMISTHGDSGSGIFRASSGYLVGVLWGGDETNPSSTSIVPLGSIQRFMETRCKDWFRPRQPPGVNTPPVVTLPPPTVLPSTPTPPSGGVQIQPGPTGPIGPPGLPGAPGAAGRDVDGSKLDAVLPVIEAVAPWVSRIPWIAGGAAAGPVGLGISLGVMGLRAWLRRRRTGNGSAELGELGETPRVVPPAGPALPLPPASPVASAPGVLEILLRLESLIRQRNEPTPTPTPSSPPAGGVPAPPATVFQDSSPIERDEREGLEHLRLHKLEGRDPLQDAIAGRLLRSRLDALAEGTADPAKSRWADELRRELDRRFNEIAPTKFSIG